MSLICKRIGALSTVLSLLLCAGFAVFADNVVVYQSNFSKGAGAEWSKTKVETSPKGKRTFLGQFGKEQVELSLGSLPAHESVTISFDLYILNSWDGNTPGTGPDKWGLSVKDGPVLLHTTFSSNEAHQAYPGEYPGGDNLSYTGAYERNTLGYDNLGNAVYRLSYTIPHTKDSITFVFDGGCNQPVWDESWGLNNVTVSVESAGPRVIPVVSSGNIVVGKGDVLKLTGKPNADFVKMTVMEVDGPAIAKKDGYGSFEFSWDTRDATIGFHDVRVFALSTDKRTEVMRANINVIDSEPVRITEPRENSKFVLPVDVRAELAQGLVLQNMELFVDGKCVSSSDKPSIKFDPSALSSGTHEIFVVAHTKSGNALSRPKLVNIEERVSFVQPFDGGKITVASEGTKVHIEARVNPLIAVKRIEFYCDGKSIGSGGSGFLKMDHDATELTPGNHSFLVVVTDDKGHAFTASRTIPVENPPLVKRQQEEAAKKEQERQVYLSQLRDDDMLGIEVLSLCRDTDIIGPIWIIQFRFSNPTSHDIWVQTSCFLVFDDYSYSTACTNRTNGLIVPAYTSIITNGWAYDFGSRFRRPVRLEYKGRRVYVPLP